MQWRILQDPWLPRTRRTGVLAKCDRMPDAILSETRTRARRRTPQPYRAEPQTQRLQAFLAAFVHRPPPLARTCATWSWEGVMVWGVRYFRLLVTAGALLLAATAAEAQYRAAVQGTVLDASGAAIPGASVVLTSLETGLARDTVSSETG